VNRDGVLAEPRPVRLNGASRPEDPMLAAHPTVTPPPEAPAPVRRQEPAGTSVPRFEPLYNVVLIDDNDHTYNYVIEMLCALFGVGFEMAYMMARAVDTEGRVVVYTTDRDTACVKRDQICRFGPDPLLPYSTGSMHAVVEPLPAG
jgi:ATP-dependent Clp protease adaptor protein ClpS